MNVRHALSFITLLLLSGCFQYGSVQTAATNGQGRFEGGLEPGIRTVLEKDDMAQVSNVTASLRYGVHDRVDVGLRLGQNAYDIHGKVMFTPAESPVLVSFAPAFFIDQYGNYAINAPALVGLRLKQHELTLGPRILLGADPVSLGLANGEKFAFGSSIGFAARLTQNFKLLPELTVIAGPEGSVSGDLKLGVLFGGRRP